jgi:hypothetical protein
VKKVPDGLGDHRLRRQLPRPHLTIVGFSSEAQYRDGSAPYSGGFVHARSAMRAPRGRDRPIPPFLVEPVQGEAGSCPA